MQRNAAVQQRHLPVVHAVHGLAAADGVALAAVHDADLAAEPGPRRGLSITVALPVAGN
ncbi:hypothetical protein ACIQMV_20120 [Streptomyces sp. NPDC091412]|uniref:hypothetical protein n=1 Tax=Streptomyces sp. NPDC091412 TaxID=3366002 RepID=UPI0038278531